MAKRIANPQDLNKVRDQARTEMDLRSGPKEIQVTIHMGTCGIAAGARKILDYFASEMSRASVKNVTLKRTGCIGLCDQEPMITLTDKSGNEFLYVKLNKHKVNQIVRSHLLDGRPALEYLAKE